MRPNVLELEYDGIPSDLKAIDRWVLWRYTQRGETWAKVPFRAADGAAASSTRGSDWCDYDAATMAYAMGDYDGLGFVLGDGYHGVDVDDCRPGGEWSPLAREALDAVPGYAEISPSGQGLKIITRSTMDRSQADHKLGLELYTAGRYFTITGHQINGHAALPVEPVDMSRFVVRHFGVARSGAAVRGDDIPKPPIAVSPEQLHGIMAAVLAAGRLDGNEDWIQAGMALHHQFRGGVDGLEIWDQYSSQAAGYKGMDDLARQWARFDRSRGSGLTFATVWGWAKTAGWVDGTKVGAAVTLAASAAVTLERYKDAIKGADYATLTGPLAAEIKADESVTKLDRAVLVGAVQRRIKALQGSLPPVDAVRAMLAPARATDEGVGPEWMAPWVCLAGDNTFVHRVNKSVLSPAGFDKTFNRLLPGAGEAMVSASRQATESWDILTVHSERYAPAAAEVFEQEGVMYLNAYRHDLVPVGYWDAAVSEALERHLKLLVPKDWEREHLKQWMAWVARNPGRKVLHAILLKGTQGDGKSTLTKIMQRAMGGNVSIVDTNAMQNSSFTEWANGACLGVFEEIHVSKDRYDVLDRLKPLITNDFIAIHPKGKPMHTVPNTMNYLAYTNHDDGVPVDDIDRRWYVLFSPWKHRRDFEAAVGDPIAYWQRLNDAISNAEAVRGWLDAVDLAGFDQFGAAPTTEHKRKMIHAAKSDIVKAIQAIIDAGDVVGVSHDAISTAHMEKALREDGYQDRDVPKTTALKHLMADLGYIDGPRVTISGKRYRTWKRDGVADSTAADWLRTVVGPLSGF